ncbi:MAG: methyltransferase domain-containing protein [Deltaproteobacteria bacterium]|nr:methyltransferase domain-containing protein [Deltaproteobacteria bacterium]
MNIMNPVKTLRGADIQPGQTVLEVGCGTGFFTIPAAKLIGDEGCLVAMDALSDFIKQVSKKVQSADLKNVRWCASLACIALKSAFARNAPRPETRREVGSMDVSGFWLGTNIDPSFWVIHVYEQTKRCV